MTHQTMASSFSERSSGLRAKSLRRYEHGPFVTCSLGSYGCRWRRNEKSGGHPGECCSSKSEGFAFFSSVAAFCSTLLFLYFWGQAKNDYNDFDWHTFGHLGFWFPWSVVSSVISAGFFTYVTVLMLLAVCLSSEGRKLHLHWSHKVGISISSVFSVAATAVLSRSWADEWATSSLSFQVTAPYLHSGGVLSMTSSAWPIALNVFRMKSNVRKVSIVGPYSIISWTLYSVPLGLYSPCIKEEGTSGPKPASIGHRGAPMLAPENTSMSFEKAVESGIDGLETDVAISYDGVPFLMHDYNLQRTTNVREIFPDRADHPAAMFTWSESEESNAGSWFLSQNPFGTAGSSGEEERARAENQSVCSSQDFSQLAGQAHKSVIFDLYRPPYHHPYSNSWIERTSDVLYNTSIQSSQVSWSPSYSRSQVHEMDPDLQQTSGSRLPSEESQRNNIVRVNLHYRWMSAELIRWVYLRRSRGEKQLREYAAENVSTNSYVISQPWLYSSAWCAGVHSVTTNAPQSLRTSNSPLFLMSPEEYSSMWILTDVLSFSVVIIIFLFHRWREGRSAFYSDGDVKRDKIICGQSEAEKGNIWSVSSSNAPAE